MDIARSSTPPQLPKLESAREAGARSSNGAQNSDGAYAFPLSPAQERIWHVYRARPLSPTYNGSFRMNLSGPLDVSIFERTFNEIIRRHEILRATIEEIDGQPMQVIAPSLTLVLRVNDLRQVPGEARERELDRHCLEEAQLPFDLEHGPLIRVGLIRMEDQRYVLTLTVHQIICDGWSIGLLMEEVQKIYAAFAQGLPPALPALAIQFVDYVVWQREMIRCPEIDQQLAYWKRKLRRYHRLEIGPDLPTPDAESCDAAIISHLLPRTLTDRLRDFSNEKGGTLFITSLAAFFAYMYRLTGLTDLAVGSPLAGRNRSELEGLIGQFVNHAVLRMEFDGEPTFEEFLPQVRDMVWEAFSNQDVPFEHVIHTVRPNVDDARNPFFVINFVCQREYGRASAFNFDFDGIRLSTLPSKSQGALYNLQFFLVEREAGWRLSLEYKTKLYSAATAKSLLDNFKRVLEVIAENPQINLPGLPLEDLPESLKRKDPSVNAGPELYAMPCSPAQQRFWLLSQIEQNDSSFHMPAAVRVTGPLLVGVLEESFRAVIERHETLRTTFEEIENEVVQIVSPPKPFILPIVDLQAVDEAIREEYLHRLIREESQKPFDLSKGPLFRVELFILGQADFVLLVSVHHILADGWSIRVLSEDLWSAYEQIAGGGKPSFPALQIQYSDYTAWLTDWLDSSEAKEHLAFWSQKLEGDLPVVDFPTDRKPTLRPASSGAIETLLLPAELSQSLKTFAQSQGTTLFTVLLAAFGSLLSCSSNQSDIIVGAPVANRREETERLIGPFAGPLCLRLDFSGSPTLNDVLRRVHQVNLDALSHAELPFEVLVDRIKMRTINGRKPIFQFYFFYQNAFLQTRQVGELTLNPFPTFSVGIPFELQLGMIERAEGIRAELQYNPDIYDLQTIHQVLADYQKILENFASHPEMALKQIKVSRTAEPVSCPRGPAAVAEFVTPRTETEKKLAAIWEDVLSTRPIGCTQDYFELGGNSLLAVRLFAEIDRVFRVRLPISTLFYAKTIAEFAQLIEKQQTGGSWCSLVPIQPNGSRLPFFCIHGGGGNVLIYRDLSQHLGPDQPFYGLQSQGLDGKSPLLQTIEEMASLYVQEIRRVQPHGPYYLGGYCLGGTIALEIAQRFREQGEEVALVAFFDTVNWARLRPRDDFDHWRYQIERIWFHVQNFLLLDFRGQRKFLAEKWKVLQSRKTIWKGSLLARWKANHKAPRESESRLLAVLWKTNDAASVAYRPKPYSGRVCDFRPKGQYSVYLEPEVNWDGIFLGPVETCYLPVYPAGMLLEPFVNELAVTLRAAIDRANETIP